MLWFQNQNSRTMSVRQEAALIATLVTTNDGLAGHDFFLSWSFVQHAVLPYLWIFPVCLTAVYLACYYVIVDRIPVFVQTLSTSTASSTTPSSTPDRKEHDNMQTDSNRQQKQRKRNHQRRKLCYQMTNGVANVCLAMVGFYLEYGPGIYSARRLAAVPPNDMVFGFDHVIAMSALQIGYQLWALPMGLWYVQESSAMIVHHFATSAVCFMSAFMSAGFRYHTPFFYGMIELSSVPLSMMNIMKDHPIALVQRYPGTYTTIRFIFAFSFLWLRLIMFVPRKYRYLYHHFALTLGSVQARQSLPWPYHLFMITVALSAIFLLFLQLYWGTIILHGLIKVVLLNKRKQKQTQQATADNDNSNNTTSNGESQATVHQPYASTTATSLNGHATVSVKKQD